MSTAHEGTSMKICCNCVCPHTLWLVAGALTCLLILSSCAKPATAPGANVPPWLLNWSPPKNDLVSQVSPQQAFAQGATLQHLSETLPLPANATNWLAIGPDAAIASVRLDSAGQFQDEILMGTTAQGTWVVSDGPIRNGLGCNNGKSTIQGIVFPEPVGGTGIVYQGTPPPDRWQYRYTSTSWYATQNLYLLDHLAIVLPRPTKGVSTIERAGDIGWQQEKAEWTSIVTPLGATATLFFACTSDSIACQHVASQALAHLNAIAPFAA